MILPLGTFYPTKEAPLQQIEPPEVLLNVAQAKVTPIPSWDKEVLEPLRAHQRAVEAQRAQLVALQAKTRYTAPTQVSTQVSGTCYDWMRAAGITHPEIAAQIFYKESGCNPLIWNTQGSGAYGICQSLPASKMSSHGADYMTNPVTQMRWCQSYGFNRYGSWPNALDFWLRNRWW